jgi:hypothetical protein
MPKRLKDKPHGKATPLEPPVASSGSGEGAQSAFKRLKEIWRARARTRPRSTGFGGLPLPDNATQW